MADKKKLKLKVLGDLESLMGDRLADRVKPKGKPAKGPEEEWDRIGEIEGATEEFQPTISQFSGEEGEETTLSNADEPGQVGDEGAEAGSLSLENLTPEEVEQLTRLWEKLQGN